MFALDCLEAIDWAADTGGYDSTHRGHVLRPEQSYISGADNP